MITGKGEFTYEWIENWVKVPQTSSAIENGRTHGIGVLENQDVVVFHQAQDGVLIYSPEGELKSQWGGDQFLGAHGLTVVKDPDGQEYLWLADETARIAVKMTLDGQEVLRLAKPPHPIYEEGLYVPTWVAVNEERYGGNGDVWVTDGYGSHLIHRYDAQGNYITSYDGTEGDAGRFDCPHGIMFDSRKASDPELYIADRSNQRVQVYDAEGKFKRVFGADGKTMDSPCGFVFDEQYCYFPELHGAIAVYDENDKLVTFLGQNKKIHMHGKWPAELMLGYPDERANVQDGMCNSPHGMAVAGNGDLYYGEWIVGGRVNKLVRQSS